ncbi:MAG: helix-turn-helix domain-containing protein [Bradymonadaceae bacterium]
MTDRPFNRDTGDTVPRDYLRRMCERGELEVKLRHQYDDMQGQRSGDTWREPAVKPDDEPINEFRADNPDKHILDSIDFGGSSGRAWIKDDDPSRIILMVHSNRYLEFRPSDAGDCDDDGASQTGAADAPQCDSSEQPQPNHEEPVMIHAQIDDIAPNTVAEDIEQELSIVDADQLARFIDENGAGELEEIVGETNASNLVDEINDLRRDEERRETNKQSISFQFTVDQQTVNKLQEFGLETADDVAEYAIEHGVDALAEIKGIGDARFDSLKPAVESYIDANYDLDDDTDDENDVDESGDDEGDDEQTLVEQFSEYRTDMPAKERGWIESLAEAGYETIDEVAETVAENGPDALTDVRGIADKGRDAIMNYLTRIPEVDIDQTDDQDDGADAETAQTSDTSDDKGSDDEPTEDESDGFDGLVPVDRPDLDDVDADDPDPMTGPFLRSVRKARTDMSCTDIGDGNVIDMHPGHWARIERGEAMTSREKYERVLDALPLDDDEVEWFWDAFDVEKSSKNKGRGGSKVRKHAKVLADVVRAMPVDTISSHIENTDHTVEEFREAREALISDDE